jgi:hypothetical protein
MKYEIISWNTMSAYDEQLQRIQSKLVDAKRTDHSFTVFGASSHRYKMNPPAAPGEVLAFETTYSISLPECYKAFLLQVGNGGKGYMNSGAGPYYGLYTLGENTDELLRAGSEKYLKYPCTLYPDMSDEDWSAMNSILDQENVSDDEYEKTISTLFGGILPIGSQGCTYLHGIVLNGPHAGRVVNLDIDRQKPKFTYENNFLDWYERWLDEIISRKLIHEKGPSWFGYAPPEVMEE